MDLDDWELLLTNTNGAFDFDPPTSNPNCSIDMDYFKNFTQNNQICNEIPAEENNILQHQNEFADTKLEEEEEEEEGIWEENNGGLNVWKWGMNGFGALFSLGLVVVTVSLVVFGHTRDNNKDKHTHQKRMKQMLKHTTKLNEVMNEAIGAPLTRADITIGGYYEEAL